MLMNVVDLFLDFVMIYVFMKGISTIIEIRIFIEVESKRETDSAETLSTKPHGGP